MVKKNKNKNTTGLTSPREIKYWLIRNSVRGNCWVVLTQLDNMLSHPGQICLNVQGEPNDAKEITLSRANMKYVYSVYLTKKILVALIEANDGSFYILRNKNRLAKKENKPEINENKESTNNEPQIQEEQPKSLEESMKQPSTDQTNLEEECDGEINEISEIERMQPIESTIIKASSLVSAIDEGMSKSDRTLLSIQKSHKMSFKNTEKDRLKEILAIDFAEYNTDKPGMINLWNRLLKERTDGEFDKSRSVDLSGHFNITGEILEESDLNVSGYIREIVFYQNVQITRFDWLKRFPNLTTVSFWYCYQLKNESIDELCKHCPKLESVNIHNCYQINNRVMVALLQCDSITKICLDSHVMICQTNPYQGVVTNKEWEVINNHTLEYLFINSDNLTNDVIDNILISCLGLKKFLMNTLVLRRLKQNLEEGLGPNEITFQSSEDLKLGFKAKRDFKIKNLLKHHYEAPYSDSMTKLIDEQKKYDSAEEEYNDVEIDPRKLLEDELMKEVEEEFDRKFA